jgi:hypothetical protein
MSAALHDDERYCPPGKLLRAMHKKFLQSPVMGLADDFSKLCVHTKKIATTFHGARDDLCVLKTLLRDMEKDPYHPTNGSCLYTWKVAGMCHDCFYYASKTECVPYIPYDNTGRINYVLHAFYIPFHVVIRSLLLQVLALSLSSRWMKRPQSYGTRPLNSRLKLHLALPLDPGVQWAQHCWGR